MVLGIFIIDWDLNEGGIISLKYPVSLQVPENIVQMLEISHNFTPGSLHISKKDFNALSYGNEDLKKVIVLVLDKYEDSEDFTKIIEQLNDILTNSQEEDNGLLLGDIKRIFDISQSVFKAREAVMMKLAQEVADLKNYKYDINSSLKYLYLNERSLKKKITYILMLHGSSSVEYLAKVLNKSGTSLKPYLEKLQEEKVIELRQNTYNLLGFYHDEVIPEE